MTIKLPPLSPETVDLINRSLTPEAMKKIEQAMECVAMSYVLDAKALNTPMTDFSREHWTSTSSVGSGPVTSLQDMVLGFEKFRMQTPLPHTDVIVTQDIFDALAKDRRLDQQCSGPAPTLVGLRVTAVRNQGEAIELYQQMKKEGRRPVLCITEDNTESRP